MRINKIFVTSVGSFILGLVVLAGSLFLWLREPKSKHDRGRVERILFIDHGRVLLETDLGVFGSGSSETDWQYISKNVPGISVANGSELWGYRTSPGFYLHDASAKMWFSADAGHSWSKWTLSLPSGDGRKPDVQRRLPAAFINEPSDSSFLLMFDHQVVRPVPNSAYEQWKVVGNKAPVANRNLLPFGGLAGLKHSEAIYIADHGHLYMSIDEAQSWSDLKVHEFDRAHFSCLQNTCYALLTRSDYESFQDWNGLLTTTLGTNEWHSIGSLDLANIRRALETTAKPRGLVDNFYGTAMLATESGVCVAGIVRSGRYSLFTRSPVHWGAVVVLALDGQLRSLPITFDSGIWDLVAAPERHIWVGAFGAFRQGLDGWTRMWSAPR